MPDELKTFEMCDIAPFFSGVEESKLANVDLRLERGQCTITKQQKRRTADLVRRAKAAEQIGRLPGRDESLHCVLNGEFALWDFVPAAIELSGQKISELTIATLGFSKRNCEALDELIGAGQVKRVAILCSHYFSAADSEIYAHMTELAAKHDFPIAAMRTHAKLLLMALGKRRIVIESSANLRSCHNCEQATIFDNPKLFRFHRDWIHGLLARGSQK